jgi:hypothetical protein
MLKHTFKILISAIIYLCATTIIFYVGLRFFRIAEAYIIDDATNKKYDLFSSKFVEIGDEIVYDSVTNLLWLKNANYFGKKFFYNDALKACENLNVHGLSGWRLPSEQEIDRMKTVYKKQEIHPIINIKSFIHGYWCINSNDSAYWLWPVRGK